MSTLVKIEETYLKLFKIVLLAILTLALLAAIVTVIKGIIDFTAKPQPVAPAQKAPEPKVDVDAFIQALEQRDQPPALRPAAPPPEAPRANPMDELAATHLAKAWSYYDAYQKACNVPTKIEQDGFMSSDFPRNSFRNWFRKYGPNFAESQDNFIRTVLAHPRVIKICVDKQGRGGVFSGALKWHMEEWDDAVAAVVQFNKEEQNRIISQENAEDARVMAKKMEGVQMLWIALIAFGVFMSLALLLIFSKIETNLRGVSLRTSQE
jgi:hypothetical protein